MANEPKSTFIIDCPTCRAKVAAPEYGRVKRNGGINPEDGDVHYGTSLVVGKCPKCSTLLAGESPQITIGGFDGEWDEWGDAVRVFPKPAKTFLSARIPKIVTDSISEAEKSLQGNANTAACVMMGRALEAVCRHLLEPSSEKSPPDGNKVQPKKHIMLGQGIRRLKEKGYIDDRLLDWSQHLHAFRNIAAHPSDESIARQDAEDLQSFVYAIIEYIYDLTDRYNEFKLRMSKKKPK